MFKIGTHSGVMHPDEVIACAVARRALGDAEFCRTRDHAKLAKCDMLIDVGGEYGENRFDHHQYKKRGEEPPYFDSDSATPMSSAGMVWKEYGRQYVISVLGPIEDDGAVDQIVRSVYTKIIRSVDHEDNYGRQRSFMEDIERPTLTDFIRMKNYHDVFHPEQENRFIEAVDFADAAISQFVSGAWADMIEYEIQKVTVTKGVHGRFDVHPSGHYVKLPKHCGFARKIIQDMGVQVLFVIYGENGRWRSISIPNGGNILHMPKTGADISRALGNIIHDKKTFSAGWTAGANSVEALIALGEFAKSGRTFRRIVWDMQYQNASKSFHDTIGVLKRRGNSLEELEKNKPSLPIPIPT